MARFGLPLIFAFLVLTSVASKEVYSGTCYYDNDWVYENGISSRPMTAYEVNQLKLYASEWAQYAAQMVRYLLNEDFFPNMPVMPCFCQNCH